MHIPKLLAVVCLAALGASSLHAQKPDTDEQAKAREKLRQAMAQLDAQTGTAPAAPAPVQPPVTAPPVAPPPSAPPQAVVATPAAPAEVVVSGGLDSDTEAKAREQLRQAEAQLEAQQPKTAAPVVKVQSQPKPVQVKAVSSDQMAASNSVPDPKKKAKVANANPVFPTDPGPSVLAAPNSKEQRLDELLRLYKADKITPADYHEQRAKILAEP